MKYDQIIKSAAKEYKVDPILIKAIITVESNWNPNAENYEANVKDYSYGLMQVRVSTAKWVTNNPKVTPAQLKTPTLNILVGTRYLAYLQKKYKTRDNTIAAYNAGRPIKSKKDPSKYVNQRYVDKVNKAYAGYKTNVGALGIAAAGLALVFFVTR